METDENDEAKVADTGISGGKPRMTIHVTVANKPQKADTDAPVEVPRDCQLQWRQQTSPITTAECTVEERRPPRHKRRPLPLAPLFPAARRPKRQIENVVLEEKWKKTSKRVRSAQVRTEKTQWCNRATP